jgi:methylenetetrahydrofolate reductase (NADPH)
MNNEGTLLNGEKIEGDFSLFTGAVANPYVRPLELNSMRLAKKVKAGVKFIQTQAVFDMSPFHEWLEIASKEVSGEKTSIIAGVFPLESASEAESLNEKHTDFNIPENIIKRLKEAGDETAQKKTGKTICVEIIKEIKKLEGIRGIHIMSGGKEGSVSEIISSSGIM